MYKQRITEHLNNEKLSQNNLAKKIGVTPSALSQYLNDLYKADIKGIEAKLSSYFELLDTAGSFNTKKPKFVETSIARVVLNTITYCHIQKSMGMVYGDAGVGKTMAITEYAKNSSEIIVLRASAAISKPKSFLKLLARNLKCSNAKLLDEIYLDLVVKLQGSEKFIIIDEAQHLPYTTLENLRDLHDECNIPIVLVGNKEIYSKMLGKCEAAFAQLFSRNAIRKELTTEHIQKEDIRKMFESLDNSAIEYLYKVAVTRWGIRGAVYAYLNAINNNDVTVSGLKKVVKLMGIVC